MTEQEFKETVLPHHSMMLAEALRLLKNRDEALDCLQDAVTSLWNSKSKLTSVGNIKAYCIKSVSNRALEMLRQRPFSYSEYDKDLLSDDTSSSAVESKEKIAILREAVKLLPENERRIVMLKALKCLSSDEIAEVSGLSTANVRVLLHRGRKRIKDYLNKKYGI